MDRNARLIRQSGPWSTHVARSLIGIVVAGFGGVGRRWNEPDIAPSCVARNVEMRKQRRNVRQMHDYQDY